jgi:hypothetical protein
MTMEATTACEQGAVDTKEIADAERGMTWTSLQKREHLHSKKEKDKQLETGKRRGKYARGDVLRALYTG